MSDRERNSEFEEFRSTEKVNPPRELSERILSAISRDLTVSPWKVFSKLSLIHFLSALFTLSICPQFGIRVAGEGMGLMRYFMGFGEYGCIMACGFFFLGASLLFATMLLRPDELRVLRSHRLAELGSLTLLSLGFFLMVDANVVIGFALAWMVGSLLGGIAVLELGWILRLARS